MRLLFLGDVVGRPGRRALAALVPRLAAQEDIEFVIANCENASGGKGVDPRSADELHETGVDVLTSGNHVWQNREIVPYMRESGRLLRPLNFPPGVPGVGWTVQKARRSEARVAVLNLIGRVFMAPVDCPFRAADEALADIRREVTRRHDEAVKRLQEWIALPSIAAEDRNYPAGENSTGLMGSRRVRRHPHRRN